MLTILSTVFTFDLYNVLVQGVNCYYPNRKYLQNQRYV